ncbi:MAG: hypothetical protein ACLFM7_12620 [Bacteroidales bacterium]
MKKLRFLILALAVMSFAAFYSCKGCGEPPREGEPAPVEQEPPAEGEGMEEDTTEGGDMEDEQEEF